MIPITKAPKDLLARRALVRIDVNSEGDLRLERSIPTLKFVSERAESMIIVSHKGRPKGGKPALSLSKYPKKIEMLLGKPIQFIPHLRFEEIRETIVHAPRGSIFLLENIRFLEGEEKNDQGLGQELASLADYFVNEAFAVSHRANASVEAVTHFIPSFAGLELEREIKMLSALKKKVQKPFIVILGGAKAEDKLGVLKEFARRADYFLLGGAPGNTFLRVRGISVGASLRAKDKETVAVLQHLPQKKIIAPIDWKGEKRKILDVGPKTIALFKKRIALAHTILWNGPLGLYEDKQFARGTHAVAKAILENKKAQAIIGGGETIAALGAAGVIDERKNVFLSTGGGAMLEFLSGKKLPGLEALKNNHL